MDVFFEGVLLGLGLASLLGPIFFALIDTGLKEGLRPGFQIGLGVWVSDFMIILLSYFFIKEIEILVNNPVFKTVFGLAGAILLIAIGIGVLIKKQEKVALSKGREKGKFLGSFFKGVMVNTLNPFTFFFWFSMMTTYVIGLQYDVNRVILFFSGILLTIIITDILKVVMAKSIRPYLQQKYINMISFLSGIVLITFGCVLAYQSMGL